jgi:hypothetical protein
MTKKKQLKLYVWTGFCPDYTDGLAIAIAETDEQARELVIAGKGYNPYDWGTLHVYDLKKPVAFAVSGGG